MGASKFETLTGKHDLDFPEYDAPPLEPMGLVRRWIAEAVERGVREPRAMAMATADARGRPSSRVVVFTSVNDRGVVFTSHSCSQKSREIAATGWASCLFYWRETGQQLALSGPVTSLGDAESDALWQARPTPLHSMSSVSCQSEPLVDAAAMRAEAQRLAAVGVPLPRPARFQGYQLEPASVEFWCSASDRLHRRLRYDWLDGDGDGRRDGQWRTCRLQP